MNEGIPRIEETRNAYAVLGDVFDFKSKYFWNFKRQVRTDAMEIVNIRFHDTVFLSRIKIDIYI